MKHITCLTIVIAAASSFAIAQLPQQIKCDPSQQPDTKCFVQEVPSHKPSTGSVAGFSNALSGSLPSSAPSVLQGHPYSGRAVTEFRQTLANGVHITQSSEALVGRDGEGRTFRTQTLTSIGPWRVRPLGNAQKPENDALTLTVITDPVKKTTIQYTSDGQMATMLPLEQSHRNISSESVDAKGNAMFTSNKTGDTLQGSPSTNKTEIPQQGSLSDARFEDLGDKDIHGIHVHGKRTREVIPARSIGNDREFEIVHETWTSSELGVVILSTQSDPRFGETTYSLLDITTTEPDPSKFRAPSGYAFKSGALAKVSMLP